MNHLKTLPLNGLERKFDGGDRYLVDGDEPPPETSSIDTFDKWMDDVLSRRHPPRHLWAPPGSRLSAFKIGAGSLVLVGAPPASGKTAFMLQVTVDAMRAQGQEGLRVLIANVEMSPPSLLDRMLARLSGIGYGFIQDRTYDEEARPRIIAAMDEMRELMPRLMFLPAPFTLEHLSERALSFDANIVVVDYVQRFAPTKSSGDSRQQTGVVMDSLRRLCDAGMAVLAVSAVNRSNYGKDAALAAFRESSELEYGADAAWLLVREGDSAAVTMRCVKSRHGRTEDVQVLFDGSKQEFRDDEAEFSWQPE